MSGSTVSCSRCGKLWPEDGRWVTWAEMDIRICFECYRHSRVKDEREKWTPRWTLDPLGSFHYYAVEGASALCGVDQQQGSEIHTTKDFHPGADYCSRCCQLKAQPYRDIVVSSWLQGPGDLYHYHLSANAPALCGQPYMMPTTVVVGDRETGIEYCDQCIDLKGKLGEEASDETT